MPVRPAGRGSKDPKACLSRWAPHTTVSGQHAPGLSFLNPGSLCPSATWERTPTPAGGSGARGTAAARWVPRVSQQRFLKPWGAVPLALCKSRDAKGAFWTGQFLAARLGAPPGRAGGCRAHGTQPGQQEGPPGSMPCSAAPSRPFSGGGLGLRPRQRPSSQFYVPEVGCEPHDGTEKYATWRGTQDSVGEVAQDKQDVGTRGHRAKNSGGGETESGIGAP